MPDSGRMSPDLMGPSGFDPDLDVGESRPTLKDPEMRACGLALIIDDNPMLAATVANLPQGPVHGKGFLRRLTGKERQISLFDLTACETTLQSHQGLVMAGQDHQPAGRAVKAMDRAPVRRYPSDHVHQPERQSGTSVHRQSRGLVDDTEIRRSGNDPRADLGHKVLGYGDRTGRLDRNRGDAHLVSGVELLHRLGAAPIDPDLSGTDQPIDKAARDAVEQAHQKIVKSLPAMIRRHAYVANPRANPFGTHKHLRCNQKAMEVSIVKMTEVIT